MAKHPFFAMKVGGASRTVLPYGRYDSQEAMLADLALRAGVPIDATKINTDEPVAIATDGGQVFAYDQRSTRDHVWHPHPTMPFLLLQGYTNALVRTEPMPDGRFLWQFRKVASYAKSIEEAKDYVEAGSEFFDVFRRNPYAV